MKLALGPVQSNAKGGRYVSLEDSEEIFYRRNCAVEILWEPGNFQDDGAKRLGICFTADPDLRDWVLSVEDTVVDNMIVQQGPFPGAPHGAGSAAPERRQGEPQGPARQGEDQLGALRLLGLKRQAHAAALGVCSPPGARRARGAAGLADGPPVWRALRGPAPHPGRCRSALLPVHLLY